MSLIAWIFGTPKFTLGMTIFRELDHLSNTDTISTIIIFIITGLGIVWVIKNMIAVRKSEKTEDELSKRILEKSSSKSFYISLYLWLMISLIGEKITISFEQIIGYGLIGMALIFLIVWIFYKINGLRDE